MHEVPLPDAAWDAKLGASVRGSGVEVEEEFVIDVPVSDVASG